MPTVHSACCDPHACVLRVLQAVAGRMFKGLMPHQAGLCFVLGDVKSCISLTPLGLWEQHEALQTAVVKALTGSSCGISCSSSRPNSFAGAAEVLAGNNAAAAAAGAKWMCLSRNKLVSCDLLSCKPGQMATAACVELEARAQPPSKLLLMVKSAGRCWLDACRTATSRRHIYNGMLQNACTATLQPQKLTLDPTSALTVAGTVKFRPFSPMQALMAEAKWLAAPLQRTDNDAALLEDRSKLAAAARQLDGRQVKLLPDER